MNTNVNSLLFLFHARKAICEVLGNSSDMSEFILNKASDYQIMEILVNDNFPTKVINSEMDLWNKFKYNISENYFELIELGFKKETLDEVYDMGPISDHGLSSTKLMLEFYTESGFLTTLINEESRKEKRKRKAEELEARYAEIRAKSQGKRKAKISSTKSKEKKRIAKNKKEYRNISAWKPVTVPDWVKNKKAKLKKPSVTATASIANADMGNKKKKEKPEKPVTTANIDSQENQEKSKPVTKKSFGAGKAALTGAAIGVTALGAYELYKRYLSKAARKCKGLSGEERTNCIERARAEAKSKSKS